MLTLSFEMIPLDGHWLRIRFHERRTLSKRSCNRSANCCSNRSSRSLYPRSAMTLPDLHGFPFALMIPATHEAG